MSFMEDFEREVARQVAGGTQQRDAKWAEEPMPLDRFLKSAEMLGAVDLSDKQYEIVRHGVRVLYPETYHELGWDETARQVFELRLALGKGSGKNTMSRLIMGYVLHVLLCMDDPRAYYGLHDGDIHFLNMATAAPQAQNAFFHPLKDSMMRSPWFAGKIEPKATKIELDKNLVVVSGHSNIESQEGLNPLIVVLDEIAGFKTAAELEVRTRTQDRTPAQSADGIHKLALSSVRSRFPETGKVISLSFCRYKNDKIDELVKEAEREHADVGLEASRKYSMRASTWEVNPLRKRSDFDDDYNADPADARARYECKPTSTKGRYFTNLLHVRRALNAPSLTGDLDNELGTHTVGIEYFYGTDPEQPNLPDAWQVSFDLSALERHRKPLAIHMDLGIKHDLAGVGASHVDGWRDVTRTVFDEAGQTEEHTTKEPVIKTDFVITFSPQKADEFAGIPPSDIQVRWIRQLVLTLMAEGWVVELFSADGYQSTQLMQDLEQHGITTELYSLDRLKAGSPEGYDTLKDVIASDRVTAPWHPLLFQELEGLVRLPSGKVDHIASSSKDAADAWAGSVRGAVTLSLTSGDNDTWTGGTMEETAQAHAQAAAASTMGWMMSPTQHTIDDGWEIRREAELHRQEFEAGRHESAPLRSSDQPF